MKAYEKDIINARLREVAADPLTVIYKDGRGRIVLDLREFLPATAADVRRLCSAIDTATDREVIAETMRDYIARCVDVLRDMREKTTGAVGTSFKADITALIKRYSADAQVLADRYGVEPVNDNEAVVLRRATVYKRFTQDDGTQTVEAVDGWMFTKYGRTFEAYKLRAGRFFILVPGTGMSCAEAASQKEIAVKVTPDLITLIDGLEERGDIDAARQAFRRLMISSGYMDAEPDDGNADDTDDKTNNNGDTADNNNKDNSKKEVATMTHTTNYFAGVKTLEELRTAYTKAMKQNHPDNGGTVEAAQEINAQYDNAFKLLKSGATIADEKDKIRWSEAEDEAIRAALYKVVHLENINIEIVGCWVWIDGATFPVKDTLRDAGYTWSKARKKWHFAPYEGKWHKGSKKTFDQLRRTYGSAEVEKEERQKINAA